MSFDIIDQRCKHRDHDGDPNVYRMAGHCSNCSTKGLVGLFTAGHNHFGKHGPCPACGCKNIQWQGLADANPETAI